MELEFLDHASDARRERPRVVRGEQLDHSRVHRPVALDERRQHGRAGRGRESFSLLGDGGRALPDARRVDDPRLRRLAIDGLGPLVEHGDGGPPAVITQADLEPHRVADATEGDGGGCAAAGEDDPPVAGADALQHQRVLAGFGALNREHLWPVAGVGGEDTADLVEDRAVRPCAGRGAVRRDQCDREGPLDRQLDGAVVFEPRDRDGGSSRPDDLARLYVDAAGPRGDADQSLGRGNRCLAVRDRRLEDRALHDDHRVRGAHDVAGAGAVVVRDVVPEAAGELLERDRARAVQAHLEDREFGVGIEAGRAAVGEGDQRVAVRRGAYAIALQELAAVLDGRPYAVDLPLDAAGEDGERGGGGGRGAAAEHEHDRQRGDRRGRRERHRRAPEQATREERAERRAERRKAHTAGVLLRRAAQLGHEARAPRRVHGALRHARQRRQLDRRAQHRLQLRPMLRVALEAVVDGRATAGDAVEADVQDVVEAHAGVRAVHGAPPIASISTRSAFRARICSPRTVPSLRPITCPISRADFSIRKRSTSTWR